jgi:putative flippase GtrA
MKSPVTPQPSSSSTEASSPMPGEAPGPGRVERQGAWRRALARHAPLLWFGLSGVLALGVDLGVLALAQPLLGHYGGRALSFWAAATFTWLFNRVVTFARARQQHRAQAGGASPAAPIWREYLSYFSSMAVGGALNYGAYALAVGLVPLVHAHPGLGVAVGSLVGMGFNFVAARRILAR